MKQIELIGLKEDSKPAYFGKEVTEFRDKTGKMGVTPSISGDYVTLFTRKGEYKLLKHSSKNLFIGTCNGVIVHVSLKKVIGKIIYC